MALLSIKLRPFVLTTALAAVLAMFPASKGFCEETISKELVGGDAVVSKECHPNGHTRVKATILIRARPEVVWQTVHEERQKDPDIAYAKILEQQADTMTLEEKFVLLPYIGTAVCVMQHTEVPLQRIDYYLLRSDRFKAMEGSWVLTSCDDGKSTILALSSYLDIGLPVPRMVLDTLTSQKLQKRVKNVRNMAESAENRIAKKAML